MDINASTNSDRRPHVKSGLNFSVENILGKPFKRKAFAFADHQHPLKSPKEELPSANNASRRSASPLSPIIESAGLHDDEESSNNNEDLLTKELQSSPGFIVSKSGITVELLGQDLWKKFHKLGTEMIITKAGRRMFPTLKVRVSGLEPKQFYALCLQISPFDDKRYRYVYHSSKWMVAGAGDPLPSSGLFFQGDSPALGEMWMSQGSISFDKLKLTNNRCTIIQGQICLHSMHKYLPKVFIVPLASEQASLSPDVLMRNFEDHGLPANSEEFTFPETAFITVTAYQNQQITKLKIDSNPFAKGFREATRTRDPQQQHHDLTSSPYFHQLSMEALFHHTTSRPNPFLFPHLNPYLATQLWMPQHPRIQEHPSEENDYHQ